MTARLFVLAILLAVATCGCVRTSRYEYNGVSSTSVGSDGSVTSSVHVEDSAYQWRGPWPVPPAHVQP